MGYLPDHGLPLIQLKEQRRDLVVALQNRNGPVNGWELMQIAAVQQAMEELVELFPTQVLANEARGLREKARKLKTPKKQLELLQRAREIVDQTCGAPPRVRVA